MCAYKNWHCRYAAVRRVSWFGLRRWNCWQLPDLHDSTSMYPRELVNEALQANLVLGQRATKAKSSGKKVIPQLLAVLLLQGGS